MIEALNATGWCKEKDTLMATYKTVMKSLSYGRLLHPRPAFKKLKVMQNVALRTATGDTQYTHLQHLHG